ncbi:unnamed protein product [Periconia digitata]|uniref:SET domain-containing protein n=1 Tax=Periconia digitata TaxID=1303443 RepID=A0A9W4UIP4_9PLEO|nr:unnamed protein product [Periconia digitata]
MARSDQYQEVVDLTGDSDDATSPRQSLDRTIVSMGRFRQSAVDTNKFIDLTVEDGLNINVAPAYRRNDARDPLPLGFAAINSRTPKLSGRASQLHPNDDAMSAPRSFPIRQPRKSGPSTNSQQPGNGSDLPRESFSASASSDNARSGSRGYAIGSSRVSRMSMDSEPTNSQSHLPNPGVNSRHSVDSRTTRTDFTTTSNDTQADSWYSSRKTQSFFDDESSGSRTPVTNPGPRSQRTADIETNRTGSKIPADSTEAGSSEPRRKNNWRWGVPMSQLKTPTRNPTNGPKPREGHGKSRSSIVSIQSPVSSGNLAIKSAAKPTTSIGVRVVRATRPGSKGTTNPAAIIPTVPLAQVPSIPSTALSPSRSSPNPAAIIPTLEQIHPGRSTAPSPTRPSPSQEPVKRAPTPIDSCDIALATAKVDSALKNHLRTVYESHAYLVKASLRRNRQALEREIRENNSNRRAGRSNTPDPQKFVQTSSPFKNMIPVHAPFTKTGEDGHESSRHYLQDLFNNPRSKTGSKSRITTRLTGFKSTAVLIPLFREYVPLKNNILAHNQTKLFNWPYFPDEDERLPMKAELMDRYRVKNLRPSWDDSLIDVHRFYGPSIEAFLKEIGIEWQDVMSFLLAPYEEIKRINNQNEHSRGEYEKKISKRQSHWEANLQINQEKWEDLMESLPPLSTHKLRLAALACDAYLEQSSFKLWHLARRSEFVKSSIIQRLRGNISTAETEFRYRNYACRICHMHNCPYHGAFEETPEAFDDTIVPQDAHSTSRTGSVLGGSDNEDVGSSNDNITSNAKPTSDSESEWESDSDIEVVTNYRRHVNTHGDLRYTRPNNKYQGFTAIPPPGEFKATWWKNKTVAGEWAKRTPFFPCEHEGPCDQAQCRCYRHGITCEKTCSCADSCKRRFPGCSCAQSANAKQNPCRTPKCPCFSLGRECDADLCADCGVAEILDPANRYSEGFAKACGNAAIQRGVPLKTYIGHSEVHGFGLYAGEDIHKDDFIGEYVGEVISNSEGERRGVIYTHQQAMYLFRLNSEQDIDSTHFSNKTRFINNANLDYTNCSSSDKLCNGVQRIGIYASVNIKAGTELFFHYGYSEQEMKNFKQPARRKNKNNISTDDRPQSPLPTATVSMNGAVRSARTDNHISVRRSRTHEIPDSDNDDEEGEQSSHRTQSNAHDDSEENSGARSAAQTRAQSMAPGGRSANRRVTRNRRLVGVTGESRRSTWRGNPGGARAGVSKRKRHGDGIEDED